MFLIVLICVSALTAVAKAESECVCDEATPLFVNGVKVKAANLKEKVVQKIAIDMDSNATSILNWMGLEASNPAVDYYKVIGTSGCYQAEVQDVQVQYEGQSYTLSMRMLGEVTKKGLMNTLCYCDAIPEDGGQSEADLCNFFAELRGKWLENVKCGLEGTC